MNSFLACWETSCVASLPSEDKVSSPQCVFIYLLFFISGPITAYCTGFRSQSLSYRLSTDVVPSRKLMCNHWAAKWSLSCHWGLAAPADRLATSWFCVRARLQNCVGRVHRCRSHIMSVLNSNPAEQLRMKQRGFLIFSLAFAAFWQTHFLEGDKNRAVSEGGPTCTWPGVWPVASRSRRWPFVTSQRTADVVTVSCV